MVLQEDDCDNFDNEDGAEENIGLACALEMFSEAKEVLNMIQSLTLPSFVDEFGVARDFEKAYERFQYIISQYKAQPHLIDPYLDEMLNSIVFLVRRQNSLELKHKAFKYLHLLTNVRGFKVVVQHLPHEVADLEPTLQLLEEQDRRDSTTWETRYSLLMWLSIIVMIPFHMSRLDSGSTKNTVMSRLVEVCKNYLGVADSCRQAAACLSAKFLTRVDVKESHLPTFMKWACEIISDPETVSWDKFGPLMSLAAILKHGKREDLLPYAPKLLFHILKSKCQEDQHSLSKKYAIKIIARIGLTFLKVRVASWRYKRGCRSLVFNLKAAHMNVQQKGEDKVAGGDNVEGLDDDDDDNYFDEVPPEIEDVIDELIQGLKSPDNVTRWSAAKGIGRVMGRLSKDLGDEIVVSVLELLNPRESEGAWHGGCLALAELGKRGLLLPSRLREVVPVVIKALTYDVLRGFNSVGSMVRDAACYVCWAFARAYDPQILEPYVMDIASALLVTACFDREIKCRRAASAAFQENVGRLGNIPHGIAIVTTADYFAVGIRQNAFLSISVYIAQYDEYTIPLIDHLLERKVDHWDPVIRELTAKALHNLSCRAPKYMAQTVLPALLNKTSSLEANARHGAILAVGEVVYGLSLLPSEHIEPQFVEEIGRIVCTIRERQQFRGLSGDLMKLACCCLADRCSLAKLPFHGEKVIDYWQELIDECFSHKVISIRQQAATSLPSVCNEYYIVDGEVKQEKRIRVLEKYTSQITSRDETVRMGYALALGVLPPFMIGDAIGKVIASLIECAKVTENTKTWAESRREALKAITALCTTVGVKSTGVYSCHPYLPSIFKCFLEGLKDYASDNRGDIGAWVREAAMSGLQVIMLAAEPEVISAEVSTRVFVGICQQAVEKIDRTRGYAGRAFSSLLHSSPPLPHVPHRMELERIFPEKACRTTINWNSARDTFPLFIQLLSLPVYSRAILLGLISSVGGLTESLVKYASSSFYEFLTAQPVSELKRLSDTIVDIFAEYQHVDRIILFLFPFLERLLSSNCLRAVLDDADSTFAAQLLSLGKKEIAKCADHKKLTLGVDLFCQLIQAKGEVGKRSLTQLSILLCHRFFWLRKIVATKLYEALTVYSDECDLSAESLEEALTLLSDTNWEFMSLQDVRDKRNQLCRILDVPVPTLVSK